VVASVGIDIVCIPNFTQQLQLPGTTFLENFTPAERTYAQKGGTKTSSGRTLTLAQRNAETLAGMWAAKEAFIKAWSSLFVGSPSPIDQDSLNMQEIEIRHDLSHRPFLNLQGNVADCFKNSPFFDTSVQNSTNFTDILCISITHDVDYASAICQIITNHS
jgi:holo-[acyl-carrier protein] synthase